MKVIEIKKACPICKGNVKGNSQVKFFCKKCNLLFEKSELASEVKEKKQVKQEPKAILEKPGKEEEKRKFIASKKGEKVHASNCFFTTKISAKNKIYFGNLDDALKQGYKRCVCLKKK